MSIKLTGATSGSIEIDVPAAVSGGDISLTLPNGVGSAGQVLKNSSSAGTLEFADGGKILQVKQTHLITADSQSLTSGTLAEISNLSVSITPKSSTSDMMVFVRWHGEFSTQTNYNHVFGVRRDSTDVGNPAAASNRPVGMATPSQGFWSNDANSTPDNVVYSFLDTTRSSGTSQITYKATVLPGATGTQYNQRTVADTDSVDGERLTSNIIVMEVAA